LAVVAAEAALSVLVLLPWLGVILDFLADIFAARHTSNLSLASVTLFLGRPGRPSLKKSVMRELLLALAPSCVFGGCFGDCFGGATVFGLLIVAIIYRAFWASIDQLIDRTIKNNERTTDE
jgi:hypothetical protein